MTDEAMDCPRCGTPTHGEPNLALGMLLMDWSCPNCAYWWVRPEAMA